MLFVVLNKAIKLNTPTKDDNPEESGLTHIGVNLEQVRIEMRIGRVICCLEPTCYILKTLTKGENHGDIGLTRVVKPENLGIG